MHPFFLIIFFTDKVMNCCINTGIFVSVEKYYDYQITRTSRGRPKIIAVGYGYIQKAKANFRNWVCDRRRETKCLVTSILQEDNGLVITAKHRHNHSPNHLVTKAENGETWGCYLYNGAPMAAASPSSYSPGPINLSQPQAS